jgi:Low affinity iron permease
MKKVVQGLGLFGHGLISVARVSRNPEGAKRLRSLAARSKSFAARYRERGLPSAPKQKGSPMPNQRLWFANFAQWVSHVTGRPITFLTAIMIILIWAVVGPFVGYSDTWQLVINTATTIITFLMVFVIQNTQNRDTAAMHIGRTDPRNTEGAQRSARPRGARR